MRRGGKLLATIFEGLKKQLQAGMSELDVNVWVEKEINALGATPTYKEPSVNFPAVICVSTNDEVVHGVPTSYLFKKGDVASFDLVITYDGMKTDAAFTTIIDDEPKDDAKRLTEATERSLYAGIDAIKPGARVGDISAAVETVLLQAQLGIVRELVGHGVGFEMHEPPEIPNYGTKGTGPLLTAGMTLAIEPMAMLGGERITHDTDGWTIRTLDGSKAAHYEHTVLVTDAGAEIMTQL